MVKITRKKGKNVNFAGTREPMFEKKEKEFNIRLKEIETAEKLILNLKSSLETKSRELVEKEEQLKNLASTWDVLNNTTLSQLKDEKIKQISST